MLTRTKIIFFLPLFCVACGGTFPLAGGIGTPYGKTADQQQNDILFCKDRARNEANTDGQQAKAFLMGLTIVGAPIAIENEKTLQREVFAKCMTAKGYTVAPVQEKKADAPQTKLTQAIASNSKQDEATQLEKIKSLRDRGLITSEEYDQKRKEILDKM